MACALDRARILLRLQPPSPPPTRELSLTQSVEGCRLALNASSGFISSTSSWHRHSTSIIGRVTFSSWSSKEQPGPDSRAWEGRTLSW